jgi:hypothetical protein
MFMSASVVNGRRPQGTLAWGAREAEAETDPNFDSNPAISIAKQTGNGRRTSTKLFPPETVLRSEIAYGIGVQLAGILAKSTRAEGSIPFRT